MDVLGHIAADESVHQLIGEATAAIGAVYRRPPVLRQEQVVCSESVARGAKLCAQAGWVSQWEALSAFGVLVPAVREETARTFLRAPLQVLARIDLLCGGDGRPGDEAAARRLSLLGKVVVSKPHEAVIPAVVLGEILAYQLFDERSGVVAQVASRVAAVAGGFDPLGLMVPEVWFGRRKAEFAELIAGFSGQDGVRDFVRFYLQAMVAGATEAAGIVAAV